MSPQTTRVSRRSFFLIAGAGGVAAAAAAILPAMLGKSLPFAADPDDAEVQASREVVLLSSIAFLGALFGRTFGAADRDELRERLDYSVEQEPQRLEDYTVLVRHLDAAARNRGATSFAAADSAIQEAILDGVMGIRYNTRFARSMSRLSPPTARHYRMRSATIPALSWLYANSGAAWRARGYERWPGIPGSWRDVLSPGHPYP